MDCLTDYSEYKSSIQHDVSGFSRDGLRFSLGKQILRDCSREGSFVTRSVTTYHIVNIYVLRVHRQLDTNISELGVALCNRERPTSRVDFLVIIPV